VKEVCKEHMKILRSYLGISDIPEERFTKVNGSCQWIDARQDYKDWMDPPEALSQLHSGNKQLSMFWVYANPGTGKTFLASHVVSQLQSLQLDCAYYYFHVGNQTSGSLAGFLRSMAYQMAVSNTAFREIIMNLKREGSAFDFDDARTIWNKLFTKGVFQVGNACAMYVYATKLTDQGVRTYSAVLGSRCHRRMQQIPGAFHHGRRRQAHISSPDFHHKSKSS
jgi:hypothetical protein